MTDSNVKDLLTTWVTISFLGLCLIIFAGQFISNNSDGALGKTEGIFNEVANNITSNLVEIDTEANRQINISSFVSSENSEQGIYVSSANTYSFFDNGAKYFKSMFALIYYVVPSPLSNIIVGILTALLAFSFIFFMFKLGKVAFG